MSGLQSHLHSCLIKEYESYETVKRASFDSLWMVDIKYLRSRSENMMNLYNLNLACYDEFHNVYNIIFDIEKKARSERVSNFLFYQITDFREATWSALRNIPFITIYCKWWLRMWGFIFITHPFSDPIIDALFQVAAPLEESLEIFETILKTLDSNGKTMSYISQAIARVTITSILFNFTRKCRIPPTRQRSLGQTQQQQGAWQYSWS